MEKDKPIEDLTQHEIMDAINTSVEPLYSLDETIADLKAMGIRDISSANDKAIMSEALKNVQIQRTLSDLSRGSKDTRSPRDYIEHHAKFLASVSTNKSIKQILDTLTVEHVNAALKITAKIDELPEAVIKKHLRTLKKKYS